MSGTPATKRIVEISRASYVRLRDAQIVVEQDGAEVGSVPPEDIGFLVIDSPAVVLTAAALGACWQHNAPVILCDSRHLPGAVLLPIAGHSLHTAILAEQMSATPALKRRLWKQVVQAKIRAQVAVATKVGAPSKALARLIPRVTSGDASNVEAQAARYYWHQVFGREFRRNTEAEGLNSLLNYGYSVMRSLVARAICAAGLHPAIGLSHSNQYNPLCLADDLMEPLRPFVDLRVWELSQKLKPSELEISRETKGELLGVAVASYRIDGQTKPLLVGVHEYVASVRRILSGQAKVIRVPVI